ncbi:DUF5320 domain-containing protein [Clostridium vincentii]|uniref:Uncharacterized protein n=1 Tax=Clostridium vincentii TaxID=52704 RepID=A0A2T0BB49_9CLOT|nr:DUF5320 domain-containing protein [Clostridium vincentii]PRR81037.1 hypothetical protein CLVI_27950 [Clostridium vincentii]
MPRRDGTGPDGNGAETGRRIGPCNENNKAEETPVLGRIGGRRRDGTGPCGNGAKTGRGIRTCNENNKVTGTPVFGRRCGRGCIWTGNDNLVTTES